MMSKRRWVGLCISFLVIVPATACAVFFILLGNGYDQYGARYGAVLYGAILGIPLWLACLGISLKSANLLVAAKLSGRVNEIAATRWSGKRG
jgi:hypothetical protein